MSTAIPALLIEAFTDRPCQGNGASVVLLNEPVGDGWMQGLARSLNQSETAFLLPAGADWMLRWFTPSCEVPLCGHATLASLLALHHWGLLGASGTTVFHSRSGALPVTINGSLACIELPAGQLLPAAPPHYLSSLVQERLGVAVEGFWRSSIGYSALLLPASAALESLTLETAMLAAEEASGLILMQPLGRPKADQQVAGLAAEYQLRFFAPGLGIPEDPVTGSAHALVAPYWLQQSGSARTVGWQCSPRPGGMIAEASSSGMIRLSGQGSVLWQGSLQMQPDTCSDAASRWQTLCGIA